MRPNGRSSSRCWRPAMRCWRPTPAAGRNSDTVRAADHHGTGPVRGQRGPGVGVAEHRGRDADILTDSIGACRRRCVAKLRRDPAIAA
jgi:hypothetical protein